MRGPLRGEKLAIVRGGVSRRRAPGLISSAIADTAAAIAAITQLVRRNAVPSPNSRFFQTR